MNKMFSKISVGVMSLQMALVTVASAHPGPAGHTHDDEWPFGAVALLGVAMGIVVVFGVRLALSKKG
ncbi:hypothetical protein [Roseibacillus persicicus]|uniref:hypothetical protein n=1 Tax=Roseibacillus persicicus TaxID=454148 RepID=UPI00280DB35F|nr:hypothetical protein [Roseibacillus persicicus]MDQ8191555.1 hypothetical protein [Roseibacillus persicicus]